MSSAQETTIHMHALTIAAQEHIRRIRRDKFGLCDNGSAVLNPLAADLRGSLQQLSEGLYSEDVHFIFELIQNAEDNAYADGIAPALSFRLMRTDPTNSPGAQGALILQNNETGFNETNVDALCAVGRSTKTKQGGYIGEKGIGFKSVFQVSAAPHVFSAGYAFRLPEHEPVTNLGYIVPQWVPAIPDLVTETGTVLILPLKTGRYASIEQALREIAPETILFLTKLRALEITIEPAYRCSVEKDDSQAPLVRMKSSMYDARTKARSTTEHVFWVETRTFKRPPHITAAKRDGITTRDITIALPLSEPGEINGSVFAYLPVRKHSGLPFLVNADFLVTASREDIKKNEPWNDWLLDCLIPTHVAALHKLVQNPQYCSHTYRYIPLPRLVEDERLRRTAAKTIQALAQQDIIITETGALARPANARRASDELRRTLAQHPRPALLQEHPLAAAILEEGYEEQLDALNVQWVSDDEITQCLNDNNWLRSRPHAWFASLYTYLHLKRDNLAKHVGTMPIVPLENGELAKSGTRTVYFTLTQEDRRFLDEVPQALRTTTSCLQQAVYSELYRDSQLLAWAREHLHLQDFKRSAYCSEVATRLTASFATIPASLIIAGTRFLALAHDTPTALPDLPLLLQDGSRTLLSDIRACRTFQHAATPIAADPETGWQHVFDEGDRTHLAVLANAYLMPEEESSAVLAFLAAIGVTDAPPPLKVLVRKDSAAATPNERQLIRSFNGRSTSEPTLTNYRAPAWLRHLEAEAGEPAGLPKRAEALLIWLRRSLQEAAGTPGWANAHLTWFFHVSHEEPFESEMLQCLKGAAWLPSNKGFRRPKDTFVNSPTIRLILGNTVPVLAESIPADLVELLGIHQHASVDILISFLHSLSSQDAREREAVTRIYGLLANERPDKTIEDAFRTQPLILLNTTKGWYTSAEVVWTDRSQSLPNQFGYLERSYPKLREFFVEKLGIKNDVDAQSFATRWAALSAGVETSEELLEHAFAHILPALLPECRRIRAGEEKPAWWDDLATNARFWCHDGKFRKPQQAFAGDDPEIRALFEHRVGFLRKPKDQSHARLEDLYRVFGVQFASEALTTRLGTITALVQQQTPQFLTKAAKAQIAAWAYNHRDEYERLKAHTLLAALLGTEEVHTPSPKIIFSLGGAEVETTKAAYWEPKRQRLYLEAARCIDPSIKEEIAETVAKGLMPNRPYRELEDLIYRVLGTSDDQAHHFIRKRDWNLPPDAKDLIDKRTSRPEASDQPSAAKTEDTTPAPANSNLPAASRLRFAA